MINATKSRINLIFTGLYFCWIGSQLIPETESENLLIAGSGVLSILGTMQTTIALTKSTRVCDQVRRQALTIVAIHDDFAGVIRTSKSLQWPCHSPILILIHFSLILTSTPA